MTALCLFGGGVEQLHPLSQRSSAVLAGCTTEMLMQPTIRTAALIYKVREFICSAVAVVAFAGGETRVLRQDISGRSARSHRSTSAVHLKRCVGLRRSLFRLAERLLHASLRPSGCLGNNQSRVAERSEGITKRNQLKGDPSSHGKNVHKSGRWPEPNNNNNPLRADVLHNTASSTPNPDSPAQNRSADRGAFLLKKKKVYKKACKDFPQCIESKVFHSKSRRPPFENT